jgi:hypothetical protein
MLFFLENELRIIPTLKVLVVLDGSDVQASFAKPTIAWLKERNIHRIREKLEEDAKKKLAELALGNQVQCGFCGEEHVWANCHNLCNFCGHFGHFKEVPYSYFLKSKTHPGVPIWWQWKESFSFAERNTKVIRSA